MPATGFFHFDEKEVTIPICLTDMKATYMLGEEYLIDLKQTIFIIWRRCALESMRLFHHLRRVAVQTGSHFGDVPDTALFIRKHA